MAFCNHCLRPVHGNGVRRREARDQNQETRPEEEKKSLVIGKEEEWPPRQGARESRPRSSKRRLTAMAKGRQGRNRRGFEQKVTEGDKWRDFQADL